MSLIFTDFSFIIILFIGLIFYWSFSKFIKIQNTILLVLCYFIYGFGSFWLLIIIFTSTIFNYFSGILLGKKFNIRTKKILLFLSILINLSNLFVFKYFDFFSENITYLLNIFGLNIEPLLLNIIVIVGISFYTLQVIAYNIDVYRGDINPIKRFIDFAVFLAYFPKLVSGPIEHPKIFIPEIEKRKKLSNCDFSGAIQLILFGYFCKVVIADLISYHIADFYLNPTTYNSTDALLITLLYTIQIYADFSAYSNIARGVSKLFGINLMINFNQPYLSTNIRAFWRNWHISLTDWLRYYLYIPLGGDRKGSKRLLLNIMIVFIISGLWHGAGLTYIIFGFFHGIFTIIYRLIYITVNKWNKNPINLIENLNGCKKKLYYRCYKFLGLIITFQFMNFTLIIFRSNDLNTAFLIIKQAYSFDSSFLEHIKQNYLLSILLFSYFFIFLIDIIQYKLKRHDILTNLHWIPQGIIYAFLIFMIIIFTNSFVKYTPFIYAGF
jgi:D-alanyl-lipoteichoic acid acyltransferase DltB (MBOAT superfamily)